MTVDPKKLEEEADALLKSSQQPPTETPTDTDDKTGSDDGSGSDAEETDSGSEQASATDQDNQPETVVGKTSPEQDTDETAGLTAENAAERIRNAQARMTRATQEAADRKRENETLRASLAEMQRQVSDLSNQLAQLRSSATSSPDNQDSGNVTTLESLIETYPEIMTPLLARIKQIEGKLDTTSKTVETVTKTQAERDQEAHAAHLARISDAHPDYLQVVETDDFKGWLERQPKKTAAILYGDGEETSRYHRGGNSDEVIGVFDDYKKAVGIAKKTAKAKENATPSLQQSRGQQNQTPKKRIYTRDEIKNMPMVEYNKLEADIDLAMSEGRVIG